MSIILKYKYLKISKTKYTSKCYVKNYNCFVALFIYFKRKKMMLNNEIKDYFFFFNEKLYCKNCIALCDVDMLLLLYKTI